MIENRSNAFYRISIIKYVLYFLLYAIIDVFASIFIMLLLAPCPCKIISSRDVVNKIVIGMKVDEVKDVLGCSPGDYGIVGTFGSFDVIIAESTLLKYDYSMTWQYSDISNIYVLILYIRDKRVTSYQHKKIKYSVTAAISNRICEIFGSKNLHGN